MNIGEKYYCSHCMRQLSEEQQCCPFCGYSGNDEDPDFALPEGTLLHNGRYELGAVVGVGGFGITYAAWDHILQIPAAIKEYFPGDYAYRNIDESDRVLVHEERMKYFRLGYERFLHEAHIIGTLQNLKSVVSVRDCFEKNNTAYIAMEFVHGVTLEQYMNSHPMRPKQVLAMMKTVIQELGQIYRQGIVHLDISPSNLVVEQNGNVKLIDFGSAIEIEGDRNSRMSAYNPDFAAPEQRDPQGRIGPWTDVYCMSGVLYYLLSGEIPVKMKTHIKKTTFVPLHIPKWQEEVIFCGLNPFAEQRIQTMEEFYARLYDVPLPEEIRELETIKRKQRKIIIMAGIAGIIFNLNCFYGLPLGEGYRYRLSYDGFHVEGVTDNWNYNTIPEKRLFIPVSDIDVTAMSIDSDGKFTVPRSIKTIGRQAFYSCGFEYVELQEGVEYIGEKAFASAKRLQEIYIPASVEVIEDDAFDQNKESLVIWGEKGSEAERYAAAKGITFAVKNESTFTTKSTND